MPVEVSCPGCASKFKLADNMIGKKAKCKRCQASFRIPGPIAANPNEESQLISAISMPIPPGASEDESIPMAMAVDESELPVDRAIPAAQLPIPTEVASLPSADPFDFSGATAAPSKPSQPSIAAASAPLSSEKPPSKAAKAPTIPTPPARPSASAPVGKPPAPVKQKASSAVKPSVIPATPAVPEAFPLAKDDPKPVEAEVTPTPETNADPFAFTAEPLPTPKVVAKTSSKEKIDKGTANLDEVKPKFPLKKSRSSEAKKEADPTPAPVESAPEPTAADNPFAFPFGSESATPGAESTPARSDPADEKNKSKGNSKPKAARSEPKQEAPPETSSTSRAEVSSDPFSFSAGPPPSSRAESIKKKPAIGKNPSPKSNKKLFVLGGVVVLVLVCGIAAIAFSKKEPINSVGNDKVAKADVKSDGKEEVAAATTPEVPIAQTKEKANKETAQKSKELAPKEAVAAPAKEQMPIFVPILTLPGNLNSFELRAAKNKPFLVQQPSQTAIQVEVPFERVKRFFPTTHRLNNDAFVVWQSKAGVSGKGEMLTLDTYSGSTGAKVDRFEFAGDGQDAKCDFSLDGKIFAVAVGGKITVWNLSDKSKLLDGFDPYADKPMQKKEGLAAVYIPNNPNNVLTVSTAGAMHLFEIATRAEIGKYIPEGGSVGKVADGKNLSPEETRSSVAVAVGGAIHQVSTLAPLSLAWKLQLTGDATRPFGLSATGTPGRFAYAFETEGDKKKDRAFLFCLPSLEPRILRWQDAAGEPTSVNWAGSDFAVVGTARGAVWFEYDNEGKTFAPLAMAQVPGGKCIHETTERAHWYLLPNPTDPAKSLMLELATPIADLLDFRNAAATKQPLETLRLDEKGLWR